MKKLNNKGYMLVEIIIASVMALVIGWFLIDVTIKLVNKNNDYYLDSVLLVDKNIITKEIMDDINDSDLNLIDVYQGEVNGEVVLTFKKGEKTIEKKLFVTKSDDDGEVIISYSTFENEEEIMVYKRTFNSNLNVGDIVVRNDNNSNLLYITIPAYTNYSDKDYGINLAIKYDKIKTNITIPELPVSTIEETVPGCYEHSLSAGQYLLEVWGAQGGSLAPDAYGGLGGYSYGKLNLIEKTTIFVCVGGQPETNTTIGEIIPGGFNGGGEGANSYFTGSKSTAVSDAIFSEMGQAGGGGTDIRIGQDSFYARVIVAGGGSGSICYWDVSEGKCSDFENGYFGGGLIGGGEDYFEEDDRPQGAQTKAGINGSFGIGADALYCKGFCYYGTPAAGGGWYGGGVVDAGPLVTNSASDAGGGSGYVYTSSTASNYPSGCLLNSSYYLTGAATVGDGTTTFTDFNGSTVTGHSGNGAARITLIS